MQYTPGLTDAHTARQVFNHVYGDVNVKATAGDFFNPFNLFSSLVELPITFLLYFPLKRAWDKLGEISASPASSDRQKGAALFGKVMMMATLVFPAIGALKWLAHSGYAPRYAYREVKTAVAERVAKRGYPRLGAFLGHTLAILNLLTISLPVAAVTAYFLTVGVMAAMLAAGAAGAVAAVAGFIATNFAIPFLVTPFSFFAGVTSFMLPTLAAPAAFTTALMTISAGLALVLPALKQALVSIRDAIRGHKSGSNIATAVAQNPPPPPASKTVVEAPNKQMQRLRKPTHLDALVIPKPDLEHAPVLKKTRRQVQLPASPINPALSVRESMDSTNAKLADVSQHLQRANEELREAQKNTNALIDSYIALGSISKDDRQRVSIVLENKHREIAADVIENTKLFEAALNDESCVQDAHASQTDIDQACFKVSSLNNHLVNANENLATASEKLVAYKSVIAEEKRLTSLIATLEKEQKSYNAELENAKRHYELQSSAPSSYLNALTKTSPQHSPNKLEVSQIKTATLRL